MGMLTLIKMNYLTLLLQVALVVMI